MWEVKYFTERWFASHCTLICVKNLKGFGIFPDMNGGLEKLLGILFFSRLKMHCKSTSNMLWKQSYMILEKDVWRGNEWLLWWQVFLYGEICYDIFWVQLPFQLALTCVQLPTFSKTVKYFLSESGNCTTDFCDD